MAGSEEFFVLKDGVKHDAGLHAELLGDDDYNPVAAKLRYADAIKRGIAEADARAAYLRP